MNQMNRSTLYITMQKELPQDVLDIICAYSKPAFIHFREFNAAMDLFRLPLEYQEKLKKKIGDPAVRTQIQICKEAANEDYEKSDKSSWWASVSRDKFVALLDDREYRMQGYAEWYFEDDIDNAWRNSDDSESYWHNEDDSDESSEVESICIPVSE